MGLTCDNCGKDFKSSYYLKRHQNSKRPCYNALPEVIPKDMCKWCGRKFAHVSSKCTHEKTCVIKKNKGKLDNMRKEKNNQQERAAMTNAIEQLREENMQLKIEQRVANQKLIKMIEELRSDKQQVDINYRSKYIQNNVVIINNALSPNTDFISKEMVEKLLDDQKLNAPIFLTAEIYYGDRPENHSLHITNQKTTEGVAYRNGMWVPLKRDDVRAYLLNGLYTSYDKILQIGQTIDRYANDVLLAEIERNQHDDKNIANEIRSLIFLAIQMAKKNDISPHFIEEDIKRGRAALKMVEDMLDDADADVNADADADTNNGKEEA